MAYYETYLWTWIAYLLAAVGMYFVVTKFTKYWRSMNAKNYIRMISAVILFTPATHDLDGASAIAPAYIVMFGELLTNGLQSALQGLIPLLFGLLIGAIVLALQALMSTKSPKQAN